MSDEPAAGRRRDDAIDVLKALAIFGVLAQHTIPGSALADVGRNVWILPAVPIFFVLAGMNLVGSSRRAEAAGNPSVRNFYGRRANRIVAPFLVVAAIAWAYALATGPPAPTISWAYGALPVDAPGNYFITALIGVVVLFPALYASFRRAPAATVVGMVALNVVVEVVMLGAGVADDLRVGDAPYAYTALPLRFLGLLALGMWLAGDARLTARRNLPVVALALPSLALLVAWDAGADVLGFFPESFQRATSVFVASWAALLVMVGLRAIPADAGASRAGAPLVAIGRASYHVFLAQMLWEAIVRDNDRALATAPLDVAACLGLGLLFHRLLPDGRALTAPRRRAGRPGPESSDI